MKKVTALLILIWALTIALTLNPAPLYAQESSQSGTLMQKLTDLKNDIASKAAEIKNEVNKKVQNKAFIGTIISISGSEITLQILDTTKTIKFDEFTKIIGAKNKEIKIDTLEEGDKIAALGDVDDKNYLITQQLVYLDNYASNSAQLIWGQIQKSQGSTITIKSKDGEIKSLVTNAQTNYFLGNNEASFADAKVEQHLLARAVPQKDGTLRARFIYFIPAPGFIKPSEKTSTIKSASPSASIKAR